KQARLRGGERADHRHAHRGARPVRLRQPSDRRLHGRESAPPGAPARHRRARRPRAARHAAPDPMESERLMTERLVFLIPIVVIASAAQTRDPPAPPVLRAVETPSTKGANSYYAGNRPPLAPNPMVKLPLGSVRPEGWLRRQLVLETKGFSGRLEEISQFCKFEGNEWTSPAGHG